MEVEVDILSHLNIIPSHKIHKIRFAQRLVAPLTLTLLRIPVTATQCAQPAAAFTIEISSGRGKGSGIS